MTDEELIPYVEQTLTYPMRKFADGLEIRDWGSWQTKMDPSFPVEDRNLLSMIRTEAHAVPAMMAEVMRYFSGHGIGRIGIFVSPDTQPLDLSDYLLKNGASLKDRFFGMVFPVDQDLGINPDPRIEVREVDLNGTTDEIAAMVDRAWGMPEGTSIKGVEELRKYDASQVFAPRIFIGFYDGTPAAFSAMDMHEDLPIIRIAGGATDPAYRGRGLYSALVKARLEVARKHGKTYLVVQAKAETSAPILKRQGFRKICSLDKYAMAVLEK